MKEEKWNLAKLFSLTQQTLLSKEKVSNYVILIQHLQYIYVYINVKVTIQYSNYSVVSFPHYSSSTVVLTVIGILVN